MATWGMVIDLGSCTGCQACVIACKAENNIPSVGPEEAAKGRVISWMQVLAEPTEGAALPPAGEGRKPEHPEADREGEVKRFLPRPCLQCDDPPCTKVCPVYATYKNPEGIVAQIYGRCIGCRFCMAACPYNAKFFNWHEYQHPAPGQNPDVSLRPKGVVEKCTFCHHRLQKARETAAAEKRRMRAGEYDTACAEACPARAITFGDLGDPDQRGLAPGAQPARVPAAGGAGDEAQGDLPDGRRGPWLSTSTQRTRCSSIRSATPAAASGSPSPPCSASSPGARRRT